MASLQYGSSPFETAFILFLSTFLNIAVFKLSSQDINVIPFPEYYNHH